MIGIAWTRVPGIALRIGALVVALASLAACGPHEPAPFVGRYTDAATGMSIVPPEGWHLANDPRLPHRKLDGPTNDPQTPSLVMMLDHAVGSLDEFALSVVKDLKSQHPSYIEMSRGKFTTDRGVAGIRLEVEGKPFGRIMLTRAYLFADGDRRYGVVFSRLATPPDRLDAVFEQSARTIELPSRPASPAEAEGR